MPDLNILDINGTDYTIVDGAAVRKTGDTMTGELNMGSNKITNLAMPTADTDAATMGYVKNNAAPAGYGLGESVVSTTVSDCNETLQNGWYRTTPNTLNQPLARGNWMRVDAYNDSWTHQEWYCDTPLTKYERYQQNGVWTDWVDCGPSAFAPAGYGLGDAMWITDGRSADTMQNNGWFSWSSGGVVNVPFPAGYMFVIARQNGKHVTQFAISSNYTGVGSLEAVTRTYGTTGWSEWEWVNPPMYPGVEYRTTERYNGQAVYAKAVNYGYIPAGESVIPHGLAGIDEVIGLHVINRSYGVFNNSKDVSSAANKTDVIVNSAWAMGGFVYIIKYTKS
jgi:hypothetical protein